MLAATKRNGVRERETDEKARGREEDDGRSAVLAAALKDIEKRFGKNAVMRLGEHYAQRVPVISSGSLGLDAALGVGGIPRGRIVEIFGPESSGKTTLALHVIAQAQKDGGTAAFVDAEHALDPTYARAIGVNLDNLLLSQPDHGEQALEIAEALVRSSAVDIVVVDSVAALVPRSEIEGEMGDAQVGAQARLMSQAMRKITGAVHRSNTCVVFINQLREKIGVMFGSPETTPGGRALKFYSSVRIDIRRITTIKDGERAVGNRTRAKVVKNKVAPPFRQAEFDVRFGTGIDADGELVDLGVEHGLLEKSGSWFLRGKEKLGQGRERAVESVKGNPALRAELETELRGKLLAAPAGSTGDVGAAASEEPAADGRSAEEGSEA